VDESHFPFAEDPKRPGEDAGPTAPPMPPEGAPVKPSAAGTSSSKGPAASAPVKGPSFMNVFRTILFLAVTAGAVALAGKRWAAAFVRFRVFSTADVSSLLAPEPAPEASVLASEGEPKKPRDVVFRLEAPGAKAVLLGGSFNGFDAGEHPLARGKDGVWETMLPLGPGRYLYKFKVDGKWTLDPSNPDSTAPPRQASVLDIK
jgi:hypothetical protein